MKTPFRELPDEARLWIYAADRPLTPAEQKAVLEALDAFLDGWQSHRRPVRGAAKVLDDRFVLVAGLIPGGDVSGCGIDASVHALDDVARDQGFGWTSHLDVFFRDVGGAVRGCKRKAFRQAVAEGSVTPETPVFDLSVGTVGELREGRFERPAGASWHARVFRIPARAS